MDEMLLHLLEVDGVLAALLLSEDGLPVASANFDNDEAETMGALTTAMLASMRATTDRLAVGDLSGASLTTDIGIIDVHTIHDLLLLIFREIDTDQITLAALLADVKEECLAFAA